MVRADAFFGTDHRSELSLRTPPTVAVTQLQQLAATVDAVDFERQRPQTKNPWLG
jgi:hypothetical protein